MNMYIKGKEHWNQAPVKKRIRFREHTYTDVQLELYDYTVEDQVSIPIKMSSFFGNSEHPFPEGHWGQTKIHKTKSYII